MAQNKFLVSFRDTFSSKGSTTTQQQDYLYGLRGVLVIESFLWLFLKTFVPAVVTNEVSGPAHQVIVRKIFSVLFWNESLISSFFIILSARSICISFLQEPTAKAFARSLLTRPLRIGIPLAFALAFSISIFSSTSTVYIDVAAQALKNPDLAIPTMPSNAIASFNTIWDVLWIVRDFGKQMANQAFPGATMWAPSLIYSQSYTTYIAMVILPFTRASWHVQAVTMFSIGSFWFNSWGWYSAAGLFVADVSQNHDLRARLGRGIKISESVSFPYWILAILSVAVGLVMKYLWVAALPQHIRAELALHPSLHLTQGVTTHTFSKDQAYARLDDYLIVVGVLFLFETSRRMRSVFSSRLLVQVGKRSLSIYVAQSLMLYVVSLRVFVALHVLKNMSVASANIVAFISYLGLTAAFAEAFYWTIERTSIWLARSLFEWSRT
ncbi:hypothetical protein E4T50_06542 [Aureobasidium sp. EXF-12298]|nr:hypothetical protein E4T50_06542 [Aureobasidium sp. EXF-12298]KAI4758932.1 hypothetical protein E4T51_08038 [Aureobasidium sp. EXF-12344]KAI4783261.1 hypothetical protein E4T52_01827 [Aureobasidium sp. EXF-3400]